VEGQTIHNDKDKLYFDDFEIVVAGGAVVEPERTLEEQGLNGPVIVQISEVD
jgi:hypothetical protein